MKILLINHYAGSPAHGMEYRPYYLSREWVRAGHEVTIISASESHVRSKQPNCNDKSSEETIDGIRYIWLNTPSYSGNGIGRVRNIASFVFRLFREAKALAERFSPELVIASSTYPMDIWPAHRIAQLAGAKLVYEVHDLWPLSPMELGKMSKWHPFILLVQAAEDYAYKHADFVISMLPKTHQYMESRGLSLSKLSIVPNGVDSNEWTEAAQELDSSLAQAMDQVRAQGKSIVGYAGAHGVANSLSTLLDAAAMMQGDSVEFFLVGGGPEKKALREVAQARNLKNVHFVDPIGKEQIPSLLKRFDISYIGLQRQPLFRFGISPNKLMDYMMAGKVVLNAIEAGNDPVSEASCGLTVRSEDPVAVVEGIRKLLSCSPAERQAMGMRGRDYVLSRHTYPVLAKRFLESIRSKE